MRLGLDFGTTNSAAAVYDGNNLRTIAVDPANDNPQVMPSLIYIDRRANVTVGTRAAEAYLQAETGRQVRWRLREAGEFEVTVASFDNDPIEYTQTMSVMVDVAARGRLLQSIKTGLFNRRYEGTQVFRRYYRLEDLIAIVLRELKQAAEATFEHPCEAVTLGRPVRFSRNPAADSRAEAVLLKAAYLAGFRDVDFQLEPVGVAHLYHRQAAERQTALVFDFGGGTLDLTIARIGGSEAPRILATGGVLVGGDDLDRAIMRALLPYFGGGDAGRLPAEMGDKLLAWQTMPELSRPRELERIRSLRGDDPAPMLALETLVTRNVGFKLFKEIERVKKLLSSQTSATLDFEYEDIAIQQTITRRRFESLISAELDMVSEGIEDVLREADLRPADIDIVLRTGGSSLVPAFYDLLTATFDAGRVQAVDPLVSVVGGFAVAAYEREQHPPPPPPTPEDMLAEVHSASGQPTATGSLRLGATLYPDRDFTVARIPAALNGLPYIQTSNVDHELDTEAALRFELLRPARVYVAYEATAASLPTWMLGFSPQNMQVEISDDYALIARVMSVYGRDFPAGPVTLGGAMAPGYNGQVIVNYVVILKELAR